MNSYKIISLDDQFVDVEFTVLGKVIKGQEDAKGIQPSFHRFDARHLPITDAAALDTYMQEQLAGKVIDATATEVPDDVKALIGVKVDFVEPTEVVTNDAVTE